MFPKFALLQDIPIEFYTFHIHALFLAKSPQKSLFYNRFRRRVSIYGSTKIPLVKILWIQKDYRDMATKFNIEFVDCTLTEQDAKPLASLGAKYDNSLPRVLERITSLGYTVKIGFYPEQLSYGVFMAPSKDNKDNQNKMISSWSDDPAEAILMCLYKHEIRFNLGEWDTKDSSQGRWG